ncbi:MAG: hypothetical protein JSR62_13880 [Nitrospira sp.]|nr:hypothetical protein [Nitrospira sp.]
MRLRRQLKTFVSATGGMGLRHVNLSLRYALGRVQDPGTDAQHLAATVGWLRLAQDVTHCGGVSAVYRWCEGWDVPYPETSGYIIGTFLACRDHFGDETFLQRARRIGDWEIALQAPSGGIFSRPGSPDTRVFNTGQVMLGWGALFDVTQEERYLDAACRAADYLLALQEGDGAWHRDTYCGPRTYHARTDWALLKIGCLSGNVNYVEAASRNLAWVMAQHTGNGWFNHCGFHDQDPITHVIDYTLIGLLESFLLQPAAFPVTPLPILMMAADAICESIDRDRVGGIRGMIPASFNKDWQSADDHSCLTGNAQLAYTLFRLCGVTGHARYREVAVTLIKALKLTQVIEGVEPEVCGALPGSYPMHTGYHANTFPNWGPKFFADALLATLHKDEHFAVSA